MSLCTRPRPSSSDRPVPDDGVAGLVFTLMAGGMQGKADSRPNRQRRGQRLRRGQPLRSTLTCRRQAVADDLPGLTSHSHYHQPLAGEMEEVRGYAYPVGLIRLDLIASADAALYTAQRSGKNRTVRAGAETEDVFAAAVEAAPLEA